MPVFLLRLVTVLGLAAATVVVTALSALAAPSLNGHNCWHRRQFNGWAWVWFVRRQHRRGTRGGQPRAGELRAAAAKQPLTAPRYDEADYSTVSAVSGPPLAALEAWGTKDCDLG